MPQCLHELHYNPVHTHTHTLSLTHNICDCGHVLYCPSSLFPASPRRGTISTNRQLQREATSWALGLAAQIPDRSGLSPALSCFLQRTEVHARWAYSPPPLRRRRRCAATAPPSFSLSLSVAAATPPASGVAESPPRASSASAVHALLVRLLLEPARLVLEVDLLTVYLKVAGAERGRERGGEERRDGRKGRPGSA